MAAAADATSAAATAAAATNFILRPAICDEDELGRRVSGLREISLGEQRDARSRRGEAAGRMDGWLAGSIDEMGGRCLGARVL